MAKKHKAPKSPNEAILQNMLGEENEIRVPRSRIETLLVELLATIGDVSFTTTAPSSANTNGKLKFVVLTDEPATKYDGYVYIITGE